MANEKGDIQRLVWPEDGNRFQWLDRLDTILSVATKAGTAVLGYQAFEKIAPGAGLSGAIVSQIAMRLATSQNLAGGAAGVATLTGMGILNVVDTENPMSNVVTLWEWIQLLHPANWGTAIREALP